MNTSTNLLIIIIKAHYYQWFFFIVHNADSLVHTSEWKMVLMEYKRIEMDDVLIVQMGDLRPQLPKP